LISTSYCLTAAHCVGGSASYYTVVLGLHDRYDTSKGRPESYQVSSYKIHESYNQGAGAYPNDVCLLRLSRTVNVAGNPYIAIANLAPSDSYNYVGDECYITGWGKLSGSQGLARVLQQAPARVLSQSECKRYWGSNIMDGHICMMGWDSSTIGACNGDSGGPMHCKRGGVTYVVGVASWVYSGCVTTYPSAYARVSYYRNWIRTNSGV